MTQESLIASKNPQHALTEHTNRQLKQQLIDNASPRFATVIAEAFYEHAGAWTTALPIPHLGLTMSPPAFRKALQYRTGHNLFSEPRLCRLCNTNSLSDMAGDHDSMCRGVGHLVQRHDAVCAIVHSIGRSSHMAPRREEANLFGDSDECPADVLFPSWSGSMDLCLDVAIMSPFATNGGVGPGLAVRRAEERKIDKYKARCQARGMAFLPFVLSTFGDFGPGTSGVLERMAVALSDVQQADARETLQSIIQRISFAGQRALAEGFLMRSET